MEDIFGQIEFRSKSDSTVMRILRSAMDKTHEKLQVMDGPIEFLHERTTFYELAAILVEGGLSIVQEETDILEGSSNKILSDLVEIRQWLQGRIQDMKLLIAAKDRELMERLENETELRQALELKDRELRMKNDDIQELPKSNQTTQDESTDKDIFKLKSSVDQQVLNLKQKLEDEKKILTTERRARISRVSSPNLSFDFLDKERTGSLVFTDDDLFGIDKISNTKSLSELSRLNQNVLIKGMSSDIDILKDTLDLAFGRMQSAEVFPLEKQWMWAIEKDIELITVKGFIGNLQENFDFELKKKFGLLKDNWLHFFLEMRTLLHELKDFFTRNDANDKGISTNSFPRRTTSESFLNISCTDNLLEDNGSSHVAKMIKNHESIICKQREQYRWLTKEGSSSKIKKEDKDKSRQERRIQDAITRLDNFTKRNHMLADRTSVSYKKRAEERRIPGSKPKPNRSSSKVESLEVGTENLQEERDGLCLQISVMEDIYKLLFRSMIKDVCCKETEGGGPSPEKSSHDHINSGKEHETAVDQLEDSTLIQIVLHYLESTIREDIYVVFFSEMIKQLKENLIEEHPFPAKEKRTETASDDQIPADDFPCDLTSQASIESLLKEDIYMVFFREMAEAWKSEMDACAIGSFFKEDVYQFVLIEAVKDTYVHLMEAETPRQFYFQERAPRSRRLNADHSLEGTPRSRRLGADGDESLIQKLDSLLKCLETEEDLMLKASSMIKEHSVNNSLVILNCEEMEERNAIEWLITDDESTFSSVSEKLERALQQLYTSKELLADLEESLEESDDFGEYGQLNKSLSFEQEDDHLSQAAQSDEVLTIIFQFRQLLDNVEHELHENLQSKCLRLEELKCQVDTLTQPVAWIRTRKLLYKKAFISRCHNLRLAESEVDLLGDQVESLLYLLERIYAVLSQNAAVLTGFFQVHDVLKLIKTELKNERPFNKKRKEVFHNN